MKLRLARLGAGFALAALIVLAAGAMWGCHGRRLPADLVPNHPHGFDFGRPPCAPAPRPATAPGEVLVRYLGVAGLWIEWEGEALLTAPFFSHPGPWRVAFGDVGWDLPAIERGLRSLPLGKLRAVLAGHSHYDHLADLPPILRDHAPGANAFVNRSGIRMLSAFGDLRERLLALEEREGRWIPLGPGSRIRFLALPSRHADHFAGLHFAGGEVRRDWESWDGKGWLSMKEGRTYAFLVDLLDAEGRPAFRIHYQDAASPAPHGFPPDDVLGERRVDLAVVCMPGAWLAEGYPEELLARVEAAHVLVTHYEDFFRDPTAPLRYVNTLTDRRAAGFLRRVEGAVAAPHGAPEPCTCGPCGPAWTMPLPGEWLRFRTASAGEERSQLGE